MAARSSCPECSGHLQAEPEETICTDCGLVVAEDRIDRGPEWRSFDGERTSPERTGAPLTRSRHDRGLTTDIGYGGNALRLTGRKRRRLSRLRREHERTRVATKTERNQVYAFTEIRRLVSALSLSESIRDRSCVLFESAQSADLLRGRSLEGFAAASVYAVCRTARISRTLDEVVEVARATESELKVAYDVLNRELGLPTGPIDPREYLPRFSSKLDLPQSVERRAAEFVGVAEERHLVSGRDPSGVAAACLYAAARETGPSVTQAEAAEVAGVTTVTVRSTYSGLTE